MNYLVPIPAAVVMILMGIVYCFFGYRFFKILLSVLGACYFASVMFYVTGIFISALPVKIIMSIIGAAVGAWTFNMLYKWCVFFLGLAAGASLSPAFLTTFQPGEPWMEWAIIIGLSLIMGMLSFTLQRFIIIMLSSAYGAGIINLGVISILVKNQFISAEPLQSPHSAASIGWIISIVSITCAGATTQSFDKKAKEI